MLEDIGAIINKGFYTWTKNLNISLPYILNIGINGLLALVAFVVLVVVFVMPELSSISNDPANIPPEQVLFILGSIAFEQFKFLMAGFLVLMVLMTFIQSYFTAGAIGMSKIAAETGDTQLSDMFLYGNQNAVNLFWTNILLVLIFLAGIVFIVPGAFLIEDFSLFLSNPNESLGNSILFAMGFFVWMMYIFIASIMLSLVKYTLVVENLDPIGALEVGIRFFMGNKLDVFLMWVTLIAVSIMFALIGNVIDLIPVISTLWTFADIAISIAVIPPLTAIWWTRLYLNRTGRKLYEGNNLLDYP